MILKVPRGFSRKLASLYEPGDFYIELQDQGITTNGGKEPARDECKGSIDIGNKLGLKDHRDERLPLPCREDACAQDLML